jgi:hypothetical protein
MQYGMKDIGHKFLGELLEINHHPIGLYTVDSQ